MKVAVHDELVEEVVDNYLVPVNIEKLNFKQNFLQNKKKTVVFKNTN